MRAEARENIENVSSDFLHQRRSALEMRRERPDVARMLPWALTKPASALWTTPTLVLP